MMPIPSAYTLLISRGDQLRDTGELEEAINCYREASELVPELADAYYKLGTVHGLRNNREAAEACYRQALAQLGGHPQAANNLGILLAQRGESQEAESQYRQALAERNDFFEAHLNLGNLLIETSRHHEALYYLRRATELGPEVSKPWDRLGITLRRLGRLQEAHTAFARAIELDPGNASAFNNLGTCLFETAEHAAAEEAFEHALSLDANLTPAWNNLLMVSNYRSLDPALVFKRHRAFGRQIENSLAVGEATAATSIPDPERPLRIGFVSGDLRRHSVSYYIESVLRHLDRRQFEPWAYYNYLLEDDRTQRLRPLFSGWREIYGIDDDTVAQMIRTDRIDILIDLGGHTNHSRLPVFARRPAPVQVTWIGYPNTTGITAIDYRLTDVIVDPVGDGDAYYSEKLWRLPRTFLSYAPPAEAPDVAPPPSGRNGQITFGSFNARVKIGDETIALWSGVLNAVPNSTLLVKSHNGLNDDEARNGLRDRFAAYGVAPERIRFHAPIGDVSEHLALYGEVDICLDTFPYHGTTTTCEALWMGVPVLSLAGDRHASRVGASVLTNAGLPELICQDSADYVRKAADLAANRQYLHDLRIGMRDRLRVSSLLDGKSLVTDLADALRTMWRIHCSGVISQQQGLPACREPLEEPIKPQLMRLHIGGAEPAFGWKNLHVEPGQHVDFIGDIRDLSHFPDASCSEIYASHVLQRVAITELEATLKGLYRILAPGGRLYLSVPDLDTLSRLVSQQDTEFEKRFLFMKMMYGSQLNPHDFHLIGLNFDFLLGFLAAAGFTSAEQVESFGIFQDASNLRVDDVPVSLNVIVEKADPDATQEEETDFGPGKDMDGPDAPIVEPEGQALTEQSFFIPRAEPQPLVLGPDVTIGMSAYGNHETTAIALRSLLTSARGDFELILVDDCSPDDGQTRAVFEHARSLHPNTKLFTFDRNLEYSGSLNAILSHATGDWIFFLSNDIFVTPSYLSEVLAVAKSNRRFGIVRGCSNFVDNMLTTHNIAPSLPLQSFRNLLQVSEQALGQGQGKFILDDFLTGDAFMVSRQVIDAIGTFDPRFYGYFADHDFGLRAQIAGFDLVLAQGAYAMHYQQANFDYLPADLQSRKIKTRWERVFENWARFKIKYDLPVDQRYPGIGPVPWRTLRNVTFDPQRHFSQPEDYSRYLV